MMKCYHEDPLISPPSFQELIRERTHERKKTTEKIRQDGLVRIVEMKSDIGVHPLNIFPKEIWLPILNNCTPKDRGNFSHVHPMFQDLLESHLIRDTLFPQAIKLLLDYFKNDKTFGGWTNIPDFAFSPFLKLRQVSKSLRNAVDLWFEETFNEHLYNCNNVPFKSKSTQNWKPTPGMIFHMFDSRDNDRLDGLIQNYTTTSTSTSREDVCISGKVFFVKAIEVVISRPRGFGFQLEDNDHDLERQLKNDIYLPFKSALLKLLQLVGNQIWCFKLTVDPIDYFSKARIGINLCDHYSMLQDCCDLMPNLKRLDISFQKEGYNFQRITKPPQNLQDQIEGHPFPTLGKLERINVDQGENIYTTLKIYEAILKANVHVQQVKFRIEDKVLKKMQMSLEPLQLEYFSWDNTTLFYSKAFDCVPKNWPLKTLKIRPSCESLKDVFKSLSAFPTLEKVSLFLSKIEIRRDNEFLNLPNLKHFECKFVGIVDYDRDDVNFFFSLQFLLHAKKLKTLQWKLWFQSEYSNVGDQLFKYLEENECPEKMVDFRCGMRDLANSNIWKVFPELELVEVEAPENFESFWGSSETKLVRHRRPGMIETCKKCLMDLSKK